MANVLIVDDEEADRLIMRTLLAPVGHELFFATNGEEAMRLFLRNDIDVVVTDIQMPHGDGLELISALKGMDRDVSIVAVSGQTPSQLQIAQMAGARSVLHKPLTRDGLTEAVEAACHPFSEGPPGVV
jgi:CheY-like chemotaxis protein